MDVALIIKILSNHRQSHCSNFPRSLTLHTISKLVEANLPPHHPVEALRSQVQSDLLELQAQGEVLAGAGNQFCMAPPVVLTKDTADLTGVMFKGDRAYLKIAHQALETDQITHKTTLYPKIRGFRRIKERLKKYGIRLLTVTDSVGNLPVPEQPKSYRLQGAEWPENPFQLLKASAAIQSYRPKAQASQCDRWQFITQTQLCDNSLIKLPTGEYLWAENEKMYELTPDEACLAMFWLDQQADFPLRVAWDEAQGRLNLQKIFLPSFYAQWLWQLSEPELDQPRTRLFKPSSRPFVCQALIQLGCTLV
jgi:hypothetical protein